MTGGTEDFQEWRPLLFSIAYRVLASVDDAEDIVQEAFVRSTGRWRRASKSSHRRLICPRSPPG